VDLGILPERTGYRRNRLFAAVNTFGAHPILPLS
jgi:hypothetical protein